MTEIAAVRSVTGFMLWIGTAHLVCGALIPFGSAFVNEYCFTLFLSNFRTLYTSDAIDPAQLAPIWGQEAADDWGVAANSLAEPFSGFVSVSYVLAAVLMVSGALLIGMALETRRSCKVRASDVTGPRVDG